MIASDFRNIVRVTLKGLGLWSPEAEELIIGTAAHESGFRDIAQIGGGPALGICQMEPDTHNDIWKNYLRYQPDKSSKLRDLFDEVAGDASCMLGNVPYAIAMCRIHYSRVPEPLPAVDDLNAQAAYWKKYYNTESGAGTVTKYTNDYHRLMGNVS